MKYLKSFKESTQYHNLNGDDEYEITQTVRDDTHDYKYLDGILYELSGNDIVVYVEEVEATEGNSFYEDQIERYIQYFEDGGITQTFPVDAYPLGGCRNLKEMIHFLDESENFDLYYELLNQHHEELYNADLFDITHDPESYGFNDSDISSIRTIEDLDLLYNEDIMEDEDRMGDYNEGLYYGFHTILEHWRDNRSYALTDFNHRFEALKRMGKKMVMVDPS